MGGGTRGTSGLMGNAGAIGGVPVIDAMMLSTGMFRGGKEGLTRIDESVRRSLRRSGFPCAAINESGGSDRRCPRRWRLPCSGGGR